jgi:transcriptional regulator with XRE-family HTH domain
LNGLTALRRSRTFTQRALADEAGIGRTTLIEIEAGRADPHPSTVKQIADALGVTPKVVRAALGTRAPVERGAEGAPTWERLLALEPRLRVLYDQARAIHDDPQRRSFCANHIWTEFKEPLARLVGWDVPPDRPAELRTERAYRVAHEAIYDQLPNCRWCFCVGSEGWDMFVRAWERSEREPLQEPEAASEPAREPWLRRDGEMGPFEVMNLAEIEEFDKRRIRRLIEADRWRDITTAPETEQAERRGFRDGFRAALGAMIAWVTEGGVPPEQAWAGLGAWASTGELADWAGERDPDAAHTPPPASPNPPIRSRAQTDAVGQTP